MATGDNNHVRAAAEGVEQRPTDSRAIGHADLAFHTRAHGEKLLAEKRQMGIGDITEQQFGASVDDFDFQREGGRSRKPEAGTRKSEVERKNIRR